MKHPLYLFALFACLFACSPAASETPSEQQSAVSPSFQGWTIAGTGLCLGFNIPTADGVAIMVPCGSGQTIHVVRVDPGHGWEPFQQLRVGNLCVRSRNPVAQYREQVSLGECDSIGELILNSRLQHSDDFDKCISAGTSPSSGSPVVWDSCSTDNLGLNWTGVGYSMLLQTGGYDPNTGRPAYWTYAARFDGLIFSVVHDAASTVVDPFAQNGFYEPTPTQIFYAQLDQFGETRITNTHFGAVGTVPTRWAVSNGQEIVFSTTRTILSGCTTFSDEWRLGRLFESSSSPMLFDFGSATNSLGCGGYVHSNGGPRDLEQMVPIGLPSFPDPAFMSEPWYCDQTQGSCP